MKDKLLVGMAQELEEQEKLLAKWPIRILRVYYTHGRRAVMKQVVLKALVLVGLADSQPPGTPNVVDKMLATYRAMGVRGVLRGLRRLLRDRKLQMVRRDQGQKTTVKRNAVSEPRAKVAYVVGAWKGESKRYRVFDMLDYLEGQGVSAFSCDSLTLLRHLEWLDGSTALVLMRLEYSQAVGRLIDEAHAKHIPVVFEIDDYIFDPSAVDAVDAIRDWPPDARRNYQLSVVRYRQTLEACDFAICSTESLSQAVKRIGKPAYVVPNGLSGRHLALAKAARDARGLRPTDGITLGYFSGTNTHNADLRVAAPAIAHILSESPQCSLLIAGPVDVPSELASFGRRVTRRPLVRWDELPAIIAQVDINIAPLELGNPFCEAKSELKYLDAAVLGIPTVASATSSYQRAIKQGYNGFTCERPEDWYQALHELVASDQLRHEVGQRALDHAVAEYGPSAIGRAVAQCFEEIAREWQRRQDRPHAVEEHTHQEAGQTTPAVLQGKMEVANPHLRISWIVPPPFAGSGGHRNIFRAVRYLRKFGHEVEVYVPECDEFTGARSLAEFVETEFGSTGARYHLGTNVRPCDGLFATHWSTVEPVLANAHRARRLLYFVQDFEPYFYPMSFDYIQAEETYRKGLAIITSGPLCKKIIEERYNGSAEFFRFPVDRSIYHPREHKSDARGTNNKVVAFFARPEMPRRLFPLGTAALDLLARRRPDVEIVVFGSDSLPTMNFTFPCTKLGVVRDLNDLADLYSRSTVGVAFSTTNPSLVPYEMMACGCGVIDVDYGYNAVNYGPGDGVLLVKPVPEAVANGIEKLCDDAALRRSITSAAAEFVGGFPDEEGMARSVEAFIVKQCQLKSE